MRTSPKSDNTAEAQTVPLCWERWEKVTQLMAAQNPAARRVLMTGRPGMGKSLTPALWAVSRGLPLTILEARPDVAAADWISHWSLKGGDTVWQTGPLGQALQQPSSMIIVNEIDRAGAEIVPVLHALLDDQRVSCLTADNGEVYRAQPGTIVVGTCNVSISDLPLALADRFTLHLAIDQPHPSAIADLGTFGEIARRLISTGWTRSDGRAPSLRAFSAMRAVTETLGLATAIDLVWPEDSEPLIDALRVAGIEVPDYEPRS